MLFVQAPEYKMARNAALNQAYPHRKYIDPDEQAELELLSRIGAAPGYRRRAFPPLSFTRLSLGEAVVGQYGGREREKFNIGEPGRMARPGQDGLRGRGRGVDRRGVAVG